MSGLSANVWLIAVIPLILGAAFFRFCLRGCGYLASALLFFALLAAGHHFLPGSVWRIVLIGVLIGFAYFCAVEALILKCSRGDRDCGKKYLIVLGAEVHGDVPSLSLRRRMERAYGHLTAYPDSVAIVSGGQGKGENISEAECMYAFLTERGVPPERVRKEERSTSTEENLRYSFEIIRSLGDEPDGIVTIVSNSYHLYRAKRLAKAQGVRAAAIPAAEGRFVCTLNFYIREAFGVTHMMIFGR